MSGCGDNTFTTSCGKVVAGLRRGINVVKREARHFREGIGYYLSDVLFWNDSPETVPPTNVIAWDDDSFVTVPSTNLNYPPVESGVDALILTQQKVTVFLPVDTDDISVPVPKSSEQNNPAQLEDEANTNTSNVEYLSELRQKHEAEISRRLQEIKKKEKAILEKQQKTKSDLAMKREAVQQQTISALMSTLTQPIIQDMQESKRFNDWMEKPD